MAEPLIEIDPPPVHATRARSLDSPPAARLNDLRRGGRTDLATVRALEEWAGSIRVLMPKKDELRLIGDGESWRVTDIAQSPASVEILWPRRRLLMELLDDDGAAELTFEPPWDAHHRTAALRRRQEHAYLCPGAGREHQYVPSAPRPRCRGVPS